MFSDQYRLADRKAESALNPRFGVVSLMWPEPSTLQQQEPAAPNGGAIRSHFSSRRACQSSARRHRRLLDSMTVRLGAPDTRARHAPISANNRLEWSPYDRAHS